MLELIKRKLSLKVSLILTLITIPPMIVAAYLITSREGANQEQLTLNTARIAAQSGAKMYGLTLEAGLDTGSFTIGDLFDSGYEEIKGFDFGDNPRFHTKYDFYTDRAVTAFQDTILESSPDFLFAVGFDNVGYLPTHNGKFELPLTGDRAKDLAGNRAKRKFTALIQKHAGHELEPSSVQPYKRDTGEDAWDVSAPVFVKGRHFGSFHVAVAIDSLIAHKRQLLFQLATVFAFLATITVGFIFLMLRRSMKPLEHLAELANEISIGEGLDKPIKPGTSDEIGQMAKSMNRLRASLQVAMNRLGE